MRYWFMYCYIRLINLIFCPDKNKADDFNTSLHQLNVDSSSTIANTDDSKEISSITSNVKVCHGSLSTEAPLVQVFWFLAWYPQRLKSDKAVHFISTKARKWQSCMHEKTFYLFRLTQVCAEQDLHHIACFFIFILVTRIWLGLFCVKHFIRWTK